MSFFSKEELEIAKHLEYSLYLLEEIQHTAKIKVREDFDGVDMEWDDFIYHYMNYILQIKTEMAKTVKRLEHGGYPVEAFFSVERLIGKYLNEIYNGPTVQTWESLKENLKKDSEDLIMHWEPVIKSFWEIYRTELDEDE